MDWKYLLKLNHDEVFGLDIGLTTVKMVQLRRKNSHFVVTAAGMAEITDENQQGKKNTAAAINNCLISAGIQTKLAVCGVCGPEVAIRYFKFPALPPQEIRSAVMLEAEQVCPFNVHDSTVDFQLLSSGEENSIQGVLVAATNNVIKRRTQSVKEASLSSVLMDVDALALLNCFNECEKALAGHTIAILNVGSSYTNLVITGGNSPSFFREIAYGGNDITMLIADELNISVATVRHALLDHGNVGENQPKLGDSLNLACKKLIVDVTETLRYYTTQEKSTTVEKIFVCGGFALAEGFVELLHNQFPAQVVLWNPFEGTGCQPEQNCRDILSSNGPAMAVAAGLAMRSI